MWFPRLPIFEKWKRVIYDYCDDSVKALLMFTLERRTYESTLEECWFRFSGSCLEDVSTSERVFAGSGFAPRMRS